MRIVRKYDISTLAGYHFDTAHKRGAGWITRPLTDAEKQMIFERGKSDFMLVNDVYGDKTQRSFGYKFVVQEGEVPVVPDESLFEKQRVVNAGFQKLKQSGAIVMAPYRVDNIKMQFHLGTELANPRERENSLVQPRSFHNDPWATIIFNDEWESANLGAMRFSMDAYFYDEYVYSPFDLGWDLHPKHFQEKFTALCTPDPTLVTSALAGANEGKMDILTTLAEMPETIKSVIEGFRLVAKLSKDVKNKEFSLTKNSARKRAELDAKLATDLARINHARLGAAKHQQRLLDNHARKVKRLHRRNIEQLLKELNDGLASIWMNFRYNIMPVKYTVDDALNLLASFYNEYDSSRAKDVFTTPITGLPDGWVAVTSLEWNVSHKCLVKSRYAVNQNLSSRILSHGSANLAKTIWELGTRTFVVDWFINAGDYLIALLGIDMSEDRKTSYSWNIQQKLAFVHERTGAKVFVDIKNYERQIINPYDCISLTVGNNLNLFRLIDSVAMLWPTVKRLLSSSK